MLLRKFCNSSRYWKARCILTVTGVAALLTMPLMAEELTTKMARDGGKAADLEVESPLKEGDQIDASAKADFQIVENTEAQNEQAVDVALVSEAFGHLIVSNLDNPGFQFDIESIIKGMRDAVSGYPSPMNEEQYERAITSIQEKIFNEMAMRNLSDANAFMDKNASESDVVVIEEGKLQYLITHEGTGKEVPTDGTPLIHYTGKYLDGTVFGSSFDNGAPITLPLERTIPGFRKGLVGMKEGEKRTLYIHPDLGYGISGHLPPNSLLVFEIELLEANRDISSSEEAPESSRDSAAVSSEEEILQ